MTLCVELLFNKLREEKKLIGIVHAVLGGQSTAG